MLSLEKVKSELEKYNYTYDNNILCGHTKSKIKWVLPAGVVNVFAFEIQATAIPLALDYGSMLQKVYILCYTVCVNIQKLKYLLQQLALFLVQKMFYDKY